MLDAICGKIGVQCHVSHSKAKNDFVPYIKTLLQQQKTSLLVDWLKLTPEETDFLIKMNRY